jgi:hypothetical protein
MNEGEKITIEEIVLQLSENFTCIIPRDRLREYKKLDWGDNGIGDRWANKKFNYTSISKAKNKTYSENDEEVLPEELVEIFLEENKGNKGILGIFVHSLRTNIVKRPIRKDIDKAIKLHPCVSCGSKTDIICDHKNDIYNDESVLDTATQTIEDFQPLCNHCNLQKRQIFKEEVRDQRIYSAKNMQKYQIFPFEFPWEKKAFDVKDLTTKKYTYWYDPVEFNRKLYIYIQWIPSLKMINKSKMIYQNK